MVPYTVRPTRAVATNMYFGLPQLKANLKYLQVAFPFLKHLKVIKMQSKRHSILYEISPLLNESYNKSYKIVLKEPVR